MNNAQHRNIFGARLAAAGLMLLALAAPVPAAADPADFYKGETITYIVATSPGGGFDGYGRLVAQYMEKHLPGATVVVQNMPGAGHVIGTNAIYAAKPDGLTIGTFNISVMYSQLKGTKGAQFDLAKMSWVGKAAADMTMVLVSAGSPYRTFADLQRAREPVLFALGSAGVGTELRLIAGAYGLNLKILLGYNGNEAQMAMRRGEVVGTLGSYASLSPFVKNGYGRFILQIGGAPIKGFGEVTQGEAIARTADQKAVNDWIYAQDAMSRVTAGPPGIPADRLEVLRTAYRKALQDPQLLAHARKRNWPIEPLIGEDIAKIARAALAQSPRILEMLKAMERAKPDGGK